MYTPSLKNTRINSDGFEWIPATFSDCLIELEHIRSLIPDCCYFRGQRLSDRLLDSTFSRKMKEKRGMKDIQRYTSEQQSNTALQHELGNDLLKNIHSVPVLKPILSELTQTIRVDGHPIDMLFEYHIHVQQNPKDPNLIEFSSLGTNLLDFSLNKNIGLFFANRNRLKSDAGALFVVHQKNLGKVFHSGKTPFQDIILRLRQTITENPLQEYQGFPRLPWPNAQLNNTLDLKRKIQEAVYIAQMDFRKDLELSWKELYTESQKQTYIKIVLLPNTVNEVNEYLISQGLTEEFLFPKTKFDKKIVKK